MDVGARDIADALAMSAEIVARSIFNPKQGFPAILAVDRRVMELMAAQGCFPRRV